LQKDIIDLKIGQVNIQGDIKTLEEKLSGQIQKVDTKCDGLDKRLSNQEFYNRGIFGGLLLIVLGGAAKFFDFLPLR
jgi:hypothetical protein